MLICLGKEELCAKSFDLFRKRTTRKLWYGTEQLFLQEDCRRACARPVIISTTDEAQALTRHILQSKRLVTIATIHTENTFLSIYVYNVQTLLNLIRRVCNKIKTWILGYSFGPVTAKFFSKNFTNGYDTIKDFPICLFWQQRRKILLWLFLTCLIYLCFSALLYRS